MLKDKKKILNAVQKITYHLKWKSNKNKADLAQQKQKDNRIAYTKYK